MEIRELRAFVAVADAGGVSAAARQLHVSQSALSQTMHALERQFGAQLLIRDHTGARPTPAGQALLREARALIDHHDRALQAIVGLKAGGAAGTSSLQIGVPLELPAELLPRVLAALAVEQGDVRVEVRHSASSAQLAALRAGELDVALVRDLPSDGQLDAVLAVREAMGVILTAGRSARAARPAGVRLEDLTDLDWIGFARSDAPAWHDQVTATLRTHGIAVPPLVGDRPVTAEVKLAAVGTGRFFALASPGWAQPLPDGLLWQPLADEPLVRRTWALWRSDDRRPGLAALVAALELPV